MHANMQFAWENMQTQAGFLIRLNKHPIFRIKPGAEELGLFKHLAGHYAWPEWLLSDTVGHNMQKTALGPES